MINRKVEWKLHLTKIYFYLRSFRKNKKKDEKPLDEVKDLWIRKTFYITTKKFPQVERRCLIQETREVPKLIIPLILIFTSEDVDPCDA
jgi:hypothetical protein